MPRLPGSQDVQRVEMRSDPGVQARSPVNDGMGEIGRALSGYADEMQKRDDVINELRAESDYKAKVAEFKDKVMSKRDITQDETLQEFRGTLNGLLDETVRNHRGRPESQVRLHANLLRNADGEFSTLAAQSLTARKKMIGDEIGKVGSEAAKLGYDGAGIDLPKQISTAMERIERFRDAMTPADFNNAQAAMRSTITQNNLQGMLDKSLGDPRYLDVIEQMLATPEIRRDLGEESYRIVNNRLNAGRAATIKANADLIRDEAKEASRREFELEKLREEYRLKGNLETQKARAGGGGSLFDPKRASEILSFGDEYAEGGGTPDQRKAFVSHAMEKAKISDVGGTEQISGVPAGVLRAIIADPKAFGDRYVIAAKNTLGQGGGELGVSSGVTPDDTLVAKIIETQTRRGVITGAPGTVKRLAQKFPVGSLPPTTAELDTQVKAYNERATRILRGSEGRMLADEYKTFKEALNFDLDAFFKNPATQAGQMKGAYKTVWTHEQGMRRQLAEAKAQGRTKDVVALQRVVSEAKAWRDGLVPAVPNQQALIMNIGNYIDRGLPVFNESTGTWLNPDAEAAKVASIVRPPLTSDQRRLAVPVPTPSAR